MSTSLLRVVERAQQDAEQGPEAIQSNGLRRVSAPPTPTGRGPARSAHETLGRTLQLLRSERQPSKSGPSGSRHATGLAKMAAPSQPAHASHVGAVQPIVGTLPASPAAGCRADMGGVATRHISGGAGWWKSPCPVLVRASGEQSPGATRPPTQRLKRSGMRWRRPGGQAILTLRALVQSSRFDQAWALLSETYRQEVIVPGNVVAFPCKRAA